jgi:DNA mismatch repair protein MutL
MVALPAFATIITRHAQYFFVNNRFVSDKLISHALTRSLSRRIASGTNTRLLCLFLDIDPESVDVNVHPSEDRSAFP